MGDTVWWGESEVIVKEKQVKCAGHTNPQLLPVVVESDLTALLMAQHPMSDP